MRRKLVIGDLMQDVRISLRGLRRAPVLALTIGRGRPGRPGPYDPSVTAAIAFTRFSIPC
jgi:hypothetical protein